MSLVKAAIAELARSHLSGLRSSVASINIPLRFARQGALRPLGCGPLAIFLDVKSAFACSILDLMTSLFDHPLVSSRYFFPRKDRPRAVFPVDVEGATLACACYGPLPDAPWLVHFHGNGEVVADYEDELPALFHAAGLNVFLAEYRGYGASTGVPAMVQMLSDVPRIVSSVSAPLDRIVVYGRSVGSIYAIEAAHVMPSIRGLVLESGMASPLERVLMRVQPEELSATTEALKSEARSHLDHEAKLGQFNGRTLILHAINDSMIDKSHAERNARACKHAELVLFESGDHNTILRWNLAEIVERVARFARAS